MIDLKLPTYAPIHGKPFSIPEEKRAEFPNYDQVLREVGYRRLKPGKRYRKTVACPVNGDGHWYTRLRLLDAETGELVTTIEVENGPRGEL